MWLKNIFFIAFCGLVLVAALAGMELQNRIAKRPEVAPAKWNHDAFDATRQTLEEEFRRHWTDRQLETAPPADMLTQARRLSLALTGTVPSLEEIRALEDQPAERRLEWWISRLLADPRSADYVAERLTRAFVGTDNGPFFVFRRRRFSSWLSEQVRANKPYDEVVRSMLAGEGLWTNDPAVNFVTATINEGQPDPIRLAGRTSRALLGMRIDCLQCHDDRLGNVELGEPDELRTGTQYDFHHLAAFFGGTSISLAGVRDRARPYEYQFLGKDEKEHVAPAIPFLKEALPEQGRLRQRLARWVTAPQNKPFARAAVNRVWALMFSRPLVEPIDDIPLEGPYPPGLELLADDFAAHGFDLHRLIRLIASSEPFQRESRADFEVTPEHERHWAVFPLTRLRPEQVAGALLQSCSVTTIDSHTHIVFQLQRFAQENAFVRRYGDVGEDEFEDHGGTIPQRLLMMNGNLLRDATRDNPLFNASSHIAMFAGDDPTAVESTYLAVLTRRPSEEETAHFTLRLQQGRRRQQAIEDLYWVLLNSTEFSWNH